MSTRPPLKRKAKPDIKSRKKSKVSTISTVDSLPWKSVSHLKTASSLEDDDGILGLEEVDNVQVIYEDTSDGRLVKFNLIGDEREKNKSDESNDFKEDSKDSIPEQISEEDAIEVRKLLPNWSRFNLHPQLLRALHDQNFTTPTPIQSSALPPALNKKDLIGIAETGSGKTLAYGLPILHQLLLRSRTSRSGTRRKIQALILAPTRELALQISSHLNSCLCSVDVKVEEADSVVSLKTPLEKEDRDGSGQTQPIPKSSKPFPVVSIAAVVGGLSAQKQRRILGRGVDVLVATPGRLWDILQEDNSLADDLRELRFLVLDEADRMVETGHFAELDNILRLTLRQHHSGDYEFESEDGGRSTETKDELQTFVFSATLSKDLQRNLKKKRNRPRRPDNNAKPASTLDDLVMRLDFRDSEPEIIDLSPKGGVVSSLQESQVDCLSADKDTYLYYFLLRYPGRSLVFLSSIDGIRRLTPLLGLLNIKIFSIHSQLEQKQRLQNLERFKSSANSVLLATDIAARGLDIPSIDHVIHYQIPRSADTYVHRNGRTARAMKNGFSLIMCAPEERKVVRALLNSLGRSESEIPAMNIDLYMLDKLKARIQLARKIDSAQHKVKKENHEKNWLKEAAEAMDIALDSDLASGAEDNNRSDSTKREKKHAKAKTEALKLELRHLLAQPLISRGISTRYITSGSNPIADELLAGESHKTMLGMKKTAAESDLAPSKKRQLKKQSSDEHYDEWSGFEPEA